MGNDYENGVEMGVDAGCPNDIYKIMRNGGFKGVTGLYSEIDLDDDILGSFPDLKEYRTADGDRTVIEN